MDAVQPLAVGRAETRADAWPKVRGATRYAADCYPEELLWAGALRPGCAHALIKRIDVAAALAVPGVFKLLTAADVPGSNRQGLVRKDQPVLAGERVRYTGDPVALVIAETRAALAEALARIVVELEPLPAVHDPVAALRPEAPLVHDDCPGNLLAQAEIRQGDALSALERCDVVVSGSFTTPVQAHGFLETENGVAWQEPDGCLTLVVSTQSPFRDRSEIGDALGLPFDRIRVICPPLGGGFGGKDGATVQCLLGLAALHSAGRPVKMVWDREENLRAGYRRHACRIDYRLGADRDGRLRAVHCRAVFDTGAYAHLGPAVMQLGMEHAAGPYRVPHALVEGWCVYTNNPVAGAMRGFGVTQVSFAGDAMIDELATRLGLDPLELRRRNALVNGDVNANGVRLTSSTGMTTCLDRLEAHPLWQTRRAWMDAAPPGKRRGVGISAVSSSTGYGRGMRDAAIAKVELATDGTFVVHGSVAEMGQGNASTFVQIAGHLLAQDAGSVAIRDPDTATAYPSGSASASRTTYVYGEALILACAQLKERLLNRAGMLLFVDDNDGLELAPGKVVHAPSRREVTLARLAALMHAEERCCLGEYVMPAQADPGNSRGFLIGYPHWLFSYAAHLARVEVDTLTGEVKVADYLAVTDGGRVLNPVVFDQQIHGGIAQGLGYALFEDLVTDHGTVRAGDFATYLMPGALDLPDLVSIACPSDDTIGPFGMKGIGEIAMNAPLPAVANAIHAACGVRLRDAPFTPERVLCALQAASAASGEP